jgi:hypothetical protein
MQINFWFVCLFLEFSGVRVRMAAGSTLQVKICSIFKYRLSKMSVYNLINGVNAF